MFYLGETYIYEYRDQQIEVDHVLCSPKLRHDRLLESIPYLKEENGICQDTELFLQVVQVNWGKAVMDFLPIIANDITRTIFQLMGKKLRIRLDELKEKEIATDEELDCALNKLQAARLINAEVSPVPDFTTYYLTKEGMSVNRKLKFEVEV